MPVEMRPTFVLPPHNMIRYEYDHPSPHFSAEQIQYINSVRAFLTDDEIKHLDGVDNFLINLNVEGLIDGGLPGLRVKDGIDTIWVKRYSNANFAKFILEFLEPYPDWFPEKERYKCLVPMSRITTPDGARFYPFEFHGDLEIWRRRLEEAAVQHGSVLGHFESGKLVLSDGSVYGICSLRVDKLKAYKTPRDW